jgi:D-tyrosyl-tRNA(Tyr) deacylase
MRAVVQRVRDCSVTVEGQVTGRIEKGLLVYLGVGQDDGEEDLAYIADKVSHLRIFPDAQGKMNLSAGELGLGILVVSQFTLYGDARNGRRPSYSSAAPPEKARDLYQHLIRELRSRGFTVEQGQFAASMEVSCSNVGPVTILLDSRKLF